MAKYLMILTALILMVACSGDDLEWSPLSENKMKWQSAKDYCEAMGARLPTINELRKIIINCPSSAAGGSCKVSYPDCLFVSCWSEDCRCDGSADSYSALGDGKDISLWSSSYRLPGSDSCAWFVFFGSGGVSSNLDSGLRHARCVR